MVSYPVNLIKHVSGETLARAGFRDSIEGHHNLSLKVDNKEVYVYIGNFFDWYKDNDFNILILGVLTKDKIDLDYYLGVYHGKRFEDYSFNKEIVRKKVRNFINNKNKVKLSLLEERINHELIKVCHNETLTP